MSTLVLLAVMSPLVRAEDGADALTGISWSASSAWTATRAASEQDILRVSFLDKRTKAEAYLVGWEVPPPATGEDVLLPDAVMRSATEVLQKLAGPDSAWAPGMADFPGELHFPLPLAVEGPRHAASFAGGASTEAWLWRGPALAVAIYTWAPRRATQEAQQLIATFRWTTSGPPAARLDLGSLAGPDAVPIIDKPASTLSIPLPDNFRVVESRDFCRGELRGFACSYATDGDGELLVVRYRTQDDTDDTSYSVNEGAFLKAVYRPLGLAEASAPPPSLTDRFFQVPRFYAEGRPLATGFVSGSTGLQALYVLEKKWGIAVLGRARSAASLEAIQAAVVQTGYDAPSTTRRAVFYGGAITSWIFGIAAFLGGGDRKGKQPRAAKLIYPALIISAAVFAWHWWTCPPLLDTWITASIPLYLPVVIVLVVLFLLAQAE